MLDGLKDAGAIARSLSRAVAAALAHGLLRPLPDGRFDPAGALRRSHVNLSVAALRRLRERKPGA